MIPTGRVLRFFHNTPWAMLESKFEEMRELIELHASGVRFSQSEVAARIGSAAPSRTIRSSGYVAVLPIYGVLTQRANVLTDISGGTSTQKASQFFRAAVADPAVKAIVLDIDSPGGDVYGTQEFANEVFNARASKRVIAVANSLAASAAYWIGSQASEFVVTPGGEVGSIGVLAVHSEASRAYQESGVTNTVVRAGRFKGEGNPYEPLNDDAANALQGRVNTYYQAFVKAVARGRGVTASRVRDGFGEGRVVGAVDAVREGMADRVATLDETLAKLGTGTSTLSSAAAIDEADAPTAAVTAEPRQGGEPDRGALERRRRELELLEVEYGSVFEHGG